MAILALNFNYYSALKIKFPLCAYKIYYRFSRRAISNVMNPLNIFFIICTYISKMYYISSKIGTRNSFHV